MYSGICDLPIRTFRGTELCHCSPITCITNIACDLMRTKGYRKRYIKPVLRPQFLLPPFSAVKKVMPTGCRPCSLAHWRTLNSLRSLGAASLEICRAQALRCDNLGGFHVVTSSLVCISGQDSTAFSRIVKHCQASNYKLQQNRRNRLMD